MNGANMETRLTNSSKEASCEIRKGNLAAFPTETVYGLGANAFSARAAGKIFIAKGRPSDNPIIVHVCKKSQIRLVASKITPVAEKIIAGFFPGPISIVLPKAKKIPKAVTGGLSTVCIRMPSLPLARRFIAACGVPIAAPSANISGGPSPTTYHHVLHDLAGKIPIILKGPPCRHGVESTVVDCTKSVPRLLRHGAISLEALEKAVGCMGVSKNSKAPLSPGMKYRHYAPKAKVVVVKSAKSISKHQKNFSYIGFDSSYGAALSARPKSKTAYARALFAFFRKSDAKKISVIYAQSVMPNGIGRAIMERLRKASSGK